MRVHPFFNLVCLALMSFLAGVVTAVDSPALGGGSPAVPDWAQARDEAARILSEIVKIDTSNPPGNETKVARHIQAILNKEGIASEILELQPGRGNLVARLRGNGTKRPILLMGHTDVVGVERERWGRKGDIH